MSADLPPSSQAAPPPAADFLVSGSNRARPREAGGWRRRRGGAASPGGEVDDQARPNSTAAPELASSPSPADLLGVLERLSAGEEAAPEVKQACRCRANCCKYNYRADYCSSCSDASC